MNTSPALLILQTCRWAPRPVGESVRHTTLSSVVCTYYGQLRKQSFATSAYVSLFSIHHFACFFSIAPPDAQDHLPINGSSMQCRQGKKQVQNMSMEVSSNTDLIDENVPQWSSCQPRRWMTGMCESSYVRSKRMELNKQVCCWRPSDHVQLLWIAKHRISNA